MADKSNNTVPYWGFYGTQNYFDTDPNASADGRAFLSGLRTLDPNASFVQTTMGDSGSPVWRLQTSVHFPGVDLNSGAYNPQYDPNDTSGSHNFDTSQLRNPNDTLQSSTFGAYTPWSNLKPQGSSLLDYLGPAAVGLFGFAAPALLGSFQAGAGALADAPMVPMEPYSPTYDSMLPFNPDDPAYDLGLGGAGAASGGDVLGDAPLQPMMPNPNPYDPMLPFNPADPSYAMSPSWLSRVLGNNPARTLSNASRIVGGGMQGGAPGAGGGGGGGLMGLGGAAPKGATDSMVALLKAFYGDPNATGREYLAMQRLGGLYG